MTVTVESEIKANFPDHEVFERFGGPFVLKTACASELIGQGCAEASIAFTDPWYDAAEEAWKIRGTGEKTEE